MRLARAAHQQLANQAGGDQLDAGEQRDDAEEQQRPVADGLVEYQSQVAHVAEDEEPDQPEEQPLLDGLDTFGADLDDDDENDRYVPPPPPPLPRISKYAVMGALGVVLGFVLFR